MTEHRVTDGSVPLEQARVHNGLVFVSGQVGRDPGGNIPAGFAAQVQLALDQLEIQLSVAGASLDTVLRTTVYIGSREQFAEMNGIYAARFRSPYPARTTVVASLALPELQFEIDAIAFVVA